MILSPLNGSFDLDIALRDAALDLGNPPTRRMITNAAIGMEVEDAYYAARGAGVLAQRIEGGERKLAAILANDRDDYQRALYHCLSGRCDMGGVLHL